MDCKTGLNSTLIALFTILLTFSFTSNIYAEESEYDFIVVGAGAGGGTLAARLAEKQYSVLLLEAGPETPSIFYKTPVAFSLASEDPSHAWAYYVEHYKQESEHFLKDSKAMCYNVLAPAIKTRCDIQDNGDCTCPPLTSRNGIYYPRGTGLGGSTANNAMINVLPKNSDWEHIADITDDDSWRSVNMKKYYDNMREWVNPKVALADNVYNSPDFHHGDNVKYQATAAYNTVYPVAPGEQYHDLEDVIDDMDQRNTVQTAKDLNQIIIDADPSVGTPEGMVQIPLGVSKGDGYRTGTRERILSAACKDDVLRPDGLSDPQRIEECKANKRWNNATGKPYLTVQTKSLVTRVLFDEQVDKNKAKRVIGVEYLEGSLLYKANIFASDQPELTPKQVFANKEIVLSAGAFNSPQLLMLSGIGDINLFKRSDINITHQRALPGVGKNLQEHYEMGIAIQTPEKNQWAQDCAILNPLKSLSYTCLGSILNLGNDNIDDTFAATNASIASYIIRSSDEDPSLGLTPYPDSTQDEPDIHAFGIPSEFTGYFNAYSIPALKSDRFTWLTLKGHTKHRGGTITLKSNDPTDYPKIEFNFYEDGDQNTAILASREIPGDDNPINYDDSASTYDLGAMVASVKFIRKIIKKSNELYNNDHGLPEGTQSFREIWAGANASTDEELEDAIRAESFGHHPTSTVAIGADDDPYAVLDTNFRVRGIAGLRVVDASSFPRVPGTFTTLPIYILAEKAADVIGNYHANCTSKTCFKDISAPVEELHQAEPLREGPQDCAVQASNSSAFLSGIQTHSDNNFLTYENGQGYDISIGSWSVIHDLDDINLPAINVANHKWLFTKPCVSGLCGSSGNLAQPINAGEFYSNWGQETHPSVTVKDYQLALSGNTTQFDEIKVGQHSKFKFSGPVETTYRINTLKSDGAYSTLTFTPGDYWIDTLYLDNHTTINVDRNGAETGTVRLFIKNIEHIGDYNNWNAANFGNYPERLFVYSYDDLVVSRGNYSGFFFSEKNIISNSYTTFEGSLLADNIQLSNNNQVWAKPNRLNVNFGNYVCW